MKVDERFMTIFTALFAVIGVGAVVTSGGGGLFGGKQEFRARSDSFTVRAGRPQTLDVLLNDSGVEGLDRSALRIEQPPRCGEAGFDDGGLSYTAGAECDGLDVLTYCAPTEGACQAAEVRITVIGAPAARSAPRVAEGVSSRQDSPNAPDSPQPMRLALPAATAEDPRPAAETAPRRAEAGRVAATAPAPETGPSLTVARTTARTGAVDLNGTDMAAPAATDGDAGVRIAGRDRRPATAAPRQLPGLGQPDGGASAGTSGFAPPSRPDEGPGPRVADAGTPMPGPAAMAPDAPSSAAPARLAMPSTPGDRLDGPPRSGTAAAPAPAAAARRQADTRVAAAPGPQAAPPPVMRAEAPAPEAEAPATRPVPAAPSAAEDIARAPDAQTGAPAAPAAAADEEQSIMASLARSNTVLGVTVSAAKALFGPSDVQTAPDRGIVSGTAPKPAEMDQIAALPGAPEAGPGAAGPAPFAPGAAGDSAPVRRQPVTVAALQLKEPRPYARLTDARTPPAAGLPLPEGAAGTGTGVQLDLPVIRPVAGGAQCQVDLALQVQVGGELLATLSSPCRPDAQFLVTHAGLAFTARTDADGVANFVVPALQSNAIVRVAFHDGAAAVQRAMVESLARMTRLAIVWTDPLQLRLRAREFDAPAGAEGDVRPANPRDFRTARRIGGGYLTQLGGTDPDAVRAQVYTIFETMRTGAGDVEFSLALAPQGEACPEAPVARVIRSERAHLVETRDFVLPFADCRTAELPGAGLGLPPVQFAGAR